jgi:hypothetical protein
MSGGVSHRRSLTNANNSVFSSSDEGNDHFSSLTNLFKFFLAHLRRDFKPGLDSMKPGRFQDRTRRYSSSSVDSYDSYVSGDSASTESISEQSPRRRRSTRFSRNDTRGHGDGPRRLSEKGPYVLREYRKIRSWDVSKLNSEFEALSMYCDEVEQNTQFSPPSTTADIIEYNIQTIIKESMMLAYERRAEDRENRLYLYRDLSDQLFRLLNLVVIERQRDCTVCGDKKRSSRFPEIIARRCRHPVNVCKTCMRNWTTAQLESAGWNRIRCPECPEIIEKDELKDLSTRETYER